MRLAIAGLALAVAACQGTPKLGESCATALVEGTLVGGGDQLGIETSPGTVAHVIWPDGVKVSTENGQFVLVGFFGQVIARQGDHLRMGGGENTNGVFQGCGEIQVGDGPS